MVTCEPGTAGMGRSDDRLMASRHVASRHVARRRGGWALIELVQLVVISGLLASLCAVLLGNAFRLHHTIVAGYRELASMDRFVDRWRADIQGATAIETTAGVADSGSADIEELALTNPGGIVRYRGVDTSIIRERIRDGQTLGIDTWDLPAGSRLTFRLENPANPGVAGVTTSRSTVVARLSYASDTARPPQQWLAIAPKFAERLPTLQQSSSPSEELP